MTLDGHVLFVGFTYTELKLVTTGRCPLATGTAVCGWDMAPSWFDSFEILASRDPMDCRALVLKSECGHRAVELQAQQRYRLVGYSAVLLDEIRVCGPDEALAGRSRPGTARRVREGWGVTPSKLNNAGAGPSFGAVCTGGKPRSPILLLQRGEGGCCFGARLPGMCASSVACGLLHAVRCC